MPTTTAINSATSGRPNVEGLAQQVVFVIDEDVGQRLTHHQPDWQQHGEQRDAEAGPLALNAGRGLGRRAGTLGARRGSGHRTNAVSGEIVGLEPIRHVENHPTAGEAAKQRASDDHSRDRDGHAQRQRDAEIGVQETDGSQRAPGCGGTRPCMAESPASAGIPTVINESCDRLATR